MLKAINIGLLILLVLLVVRAVRGTGSWMDVCQLQDKIKQQQKKMLEFKGRNEQLLQEIEQIKTNPAAIEEQARNGLGMIKQNESYYQVIEPVE